MKNLLSGIDSQAGKIAFQTYKIQHGIEKIEVLVPLSYAKAFEEQIQLQHLPTRAAVLEVLRSHGGELKK